MPRRAIVSLCLLALALPARAGAAMTDATTIDGPSSDIVGLGGVAMAEDGTGGLVYLKRTDGHAHVYVSRFDGTAWGAPQRVDVGQQFDSAWPAIGAGNGGRLVIVWAQDFGPGVDRLFSASLDPGASGFRAPVTVDFNIGEDTATQTTIAMSRGGQALLAYRYLPDLSPDPSLPPGYLNSDLRLARYSGYTWSTFGTPADRNVSQPVRQPTSDNAPRVAIDVTGQGLVAWQEPDDDFVDRVWARRVFSSGTFGIPLLVSPQQWNDKPLRGPADQFSVSESGFGQAGVVFRQQPGANSPLRGGTRIMLAEIPDQFADGAGKFEDPRIVDGAGDAGLGGGVGTASLGVAPQGQFMTAFGLGSSVLAVTGDDQSLGGQERLDDGSGGVPTDPVVAFGDDGSSASAWKTGDGSSGGVVLREATAAGIVTTKSVSGSRGGPVDDLRVAGSGLGDALVAFQQGGRDLAQIAAAAVDAPPETFSVHTPIGWLRSRRYRFSWDLPEYALGGVTYTVTVDDQQVGDPTARPWAMLGPDVLDQGRHSVAVIATDSAGQETESQQGEIAVDRSAPHARVRVRGAEVDVTLSDAPSGVRSSATTIGWGDGRSTPFAGARARHRYRRPGRYVVVVRARDRAGNGATTSRSLRVK